MYLGRDLLIPSLCYEHAGAGSLQRLFGWVGLIGRI